METQQNFKIYKKVNININQIILMKGIGNYSNILFENGESLLVAKTLKTLEKKLSDGQYFYRSHKAFLVNLSHIVEIDEDKLTMTNNSAALISRRKKIGLIQSYNYFQKN
jgi:two-component system, LytTR family, response regulator